jgi:basic amino acid/polyamine antiporter, APA family
LASEHLNSDHKRPELQPTLGWLSATCIVTGSMLGSGIFIVSADITRTLGTAGLLMAVWIFSGILTVLGASAYGKLAAHMPKAGGQYVFLKEAWGEIPAFLYGWSLLTVIQSGFLAAVSVAFSKFLGVLLPVISSNPISPMIPFSRQGLLAVIVLLVLTLYNSTGVKSGAILQNIFTILKVIALFFLIIFGFFMGHHLWDGSINWSLSLPKVQSEHGSWLTLFIFASVGALFSSDGWNYVTFIGSEIKEPSKNLPKALTLGTALVVILYAAVNLAYLNLLPLSSIQHAGEDRVATAAIENVFPGFGVIAMASIILISTFGCVNGMLLAGARVFYAMAKDDLLFKKFGEVNPKTHTPNFSMWMQFLWASVLALSGTYGQLLDYIVFTALIFYIVTIAGLIRMGKSVPELNMKSTWDYGLAGLYIAGASLIAFYLLFGDLFTPHFIERCTHDFYHTKFFTSVAGLALTGLGLPVYFCWKKMAAK